jgi:Zn finger protein HypA/HybF involved in hydrogenase expression
MEMENEAFNDTINDLIGMLPDEHDESIMDSQEVHCMNCIWEGIKSQLDTSDSVYDYRCPECGSPHAIKYYPIVQLTLKEYAESIKDDSETMLVIYEYCKEKTNTYGEIESGGTFYIDKDSLYPVFKESIEQYQSGNVICTVCQGSGQRYQFNNWSDCEICGGDYFIAKDERNES